MQATTVKAFGVKTFSVKAFKDPRSHLITGLLALFTLAALNIGVKTAFPLFLYTVGFTVAADQLFVYLKTKKLFFPYSGLISGLIIALIIEPTLPWFQILTIGMIAMLSKHYLRVTKRHIFNPAAFGLFAGGVLFGIYPSWWAAYLYSGETMLPINILIYLVLGYLFWVAAYKYRRYFNIVAFLIVFPILFELLGGKFSLTSLLLTLKSPGLLFYAFVMVPEPMTSPVKKQRQLLFGGFIALVNVIMTYLTSRQVVPAIDTSVLALLLANMVFFKFR